MDWFTTYTADYTPADAADLAGAIAHANAHGLKYRRINRNNAEPNCFLVWPVKAPRPTKQSA